MSHFLVLVIGNDYKDQLEPYKNQSNDPENNPYFIFKDMSNSEEEKQKYDTEKVELIDYLGKVYSKYDKKFYRIKSGTYEEELMLPKGATIRQGFIKELYPTYEDYLNEYCGYDFNDTKQAYGYWYNPNAKWDWYQVGGRWTGYFKLKKNKYKVNQNFSIKTSKTKSDWADSVLLGDIDIQGMIKDAKKTANQIYNIIEGLLKGRQYPVWKDILAKYGEQNIDVARAEFYENEVVKDFNDAKFFVLGDFYEEYGNSRQEYINKCVKKVMVPFAFVKDGNWYERGKMGWWGIVNNVVEENEWNEKCHQLISELPHDTLITAVDCHI
jgi:hypothetical protein